MHITGPQPSCIISIKEEFHNVLHAEIWSATKITFFLKYLDPVSLNI